MKDKEVELGEKTWIMGSEENERKAAKMVMELSQDNQKDQKEWETRWLMIFDGKRFHKMEYHLAMRMLLLSLIGNAEIPVGYQTDVLASEEGVVLKVRTPDGRIFAQGVEGVGTPKYDFQAMITVSIRLENTVDRLEKRDESSIATPEGLILPGTNDYERVINAE